MVSLTWGLMEAKKQIYISGHIKSVQSDSPFDKSGGVCFVDAGPITEYVYRVTHLVDENLPLTQFRQFWQLVGRYCSYLLPRQNNGTS